MDQACGISGHPASELRRISAETGVDASDQAFSQLLDDRDQLNSFRQKFAYPRKKTLPGVDGKLCNLEDESIYLCGNSLGLMPLAAPHYINRELEKWATTGVHGHHNGDLPWARCDDYVITRSAELVGALPEEVSCQSGLSVNLHLLFAAFYNPTKERHKILMEGKAFPSDHYMVTSQAKFHGYDPETSIICVEPRKEDECIDIDELIAIIEQRGSEIAIIFLSGVQYYTGQLFDMQRITEAGHRQGCIVGFDLAHAIGNVSLRMHEWKVDFAAWCTYKYLNSGAGGIAGMFFHKKWHDDVRSAEGLEPLLRFEGWWGHQHSTRFKMDNKRDLVPGAEGFRISNPPPLLVAPLVASLEEAGVVFVRNLPHHQQKMRKPVKGMRYMEM